MSLFASAEMARAYAEARPPLHAKMVAEALDGIPQAAWAIDLGSGSGLSTRALLPFAERVIGIEPVDAMVDVARQIVPDAEFAMGGVESLPYESASCPLMAAAGSLNYCDVPQGFVEMQRVLAPGGLLLVYDFSVGLAPELREWFAAFRAKYPPPPPGTRTELDPETLSQYMPIQKSRVGDWKLSVSADFFLRYMLSETNVSQAVAAGETLDSIRDWCRPGIEAAFAGRELELAFPGYFALLQAPQG
jgi:SAM-dependent methyltransferase